MNLYTKGWQIYLTLGENDYTNPQTSLSRVNIQKQNLIV